MKLQRIDPLSLGKMVGLVQAVIGLFFGVIVAFVSFIPGALLSHQIGFGMQALFPAGLGLAAIIVWPIVQEIMGFVMGAVVAFLYNFIASQTGGVEFVTSPR